MKSNTVADRIKRNTLPFSIERWFASIYFAVKMKTIFNDGYVYVREYTFIDCSVLTVRIYWSDIQ